MSAKCSTPNPNIQWLDNAGNIAIGASLHTYAAGGTTPLATYTDQTGVSANTNPVILDSAGRANVWTTPGVSYRFDLYASNGVLLWTVDNIPGGTLAGTSSVTANYVFAGPTSGGAAAPAFRALVAADIPDISATYANLALSNLAAVSINATLNPQTTLDLGAAATAWRFLFLYGAGTYSSTSFKFTGTPTGNRVLTFQDSSDTIVGRATTDTLTNKTLTTPTIADFTNANHTHQSAAQGGLLPPPRYPVNVLSANGAIGPHTAAAYVITKAGICGLTLGAPTATTDDFIRIVVTSNTAFAHTITATGLYQSGAAAVNLATFAAFAGATIVLMAYQGFWNVISINGVTMS